MPDGDEEPEQPRRRTGYEPYKGTVYGVRFGTPGNLPGRLDVPKERSWLPVVLGAAGALLLVVIVIAAIALG